MICPRCGTDNRDGARFCDECGSVLTPSLFASEERRTVPFEELADSQAVTADLSEETEPFEEDGDTGMLPTPGPRSQGASSDTLYVGSLDPHLADIPPASHVPSSLKGPSETQEMPAVGVADTQSKAYRAGDAGGKKPKMPKASRRPSKAVLAAIIVIAVLLLGAGCAFATYSLELWGGKVVPNVIGLKAEDATDKLEAAGFTVSQVLVKSDDVEGVVLRTSPEPDRRAEEGSEVVMDVSCARTVPDVLGLTQDEALSLLTAEGFESIEVTEEKSNEAAGSVIAVNPEVGVRAKAQSTIGLTVAIPFVVPDVFGMSLEEATTALHGEGYAVTTATVYTEEAPEGSVLSTDPPAGTQLASGETVCINIAKSRAAEVIALARSWFSGARNYTIAGMSYELQSVDAVDYQGDDSCSFTVTMRPYETHAWFGSQPETRYGNDQRVSGTMRFSSSGQLDSIDPEIKKAQ